MKNLSRATIAGIAYTLGNILVKGLTFLTLPIFSRLLTVQEFGIYNVFISYESILSIFIGMALHTSIKRAKYEFDNEIDSYTSSICLIYLINFIIFIIIGYIFMPFWKETLKFSGVIIYSLIIYAFSASILTLYNYRISLNYSYKKYLIIALLNSLGNILLSFLFIFTIFKNQKDLGRILGGTIPIFILAIFILIYFFKKSKPKIITKYWRFGIFYSLPIIPHGISQIILNQFDRIMIKNIIGASAAGIYSLASNIQLILVVITESITSSWSTWFFEQIERKNNLLIQKKAAEIVGLYTLIASGVLFISPEIINILGGVEYSQGKYIAIPMILDAYCLFVYSLIVQSEYYMKKTKFVMYGTLVAAIINIILNSLFISRYGYISAAYTTLFAYICYLGLHYYISWKLIGFHVVKPKYLVMYSFFIIISSILVLLVMNSLVIRLFLGLLVILFIFIYLRYVTIKKDEEKQS